MKVLGELKWLLVGMFLVLWVSGYVLLYKSLGEFLSVTALHAETGTPLAFTAIRLFSLESSTPFKTVYRVPSGSGKIRCPFKLETENDVVRCLDLYQLYVPPVTENGWVGGMSIYIGNREGQWEVIAQRFSEPHARQFKIELAPKP